MESRIQDCLRLFFTFNVVWFVSITLIFSFGGGGGGITVMIQDHPHDYYGNKPTKICKVVYHLHGVDKKTPATQATGISM